MYRLRAFWASVLLAPLLLLVLAGCSGPCDAGPGPNLDPNLLSDNGLIYLNSPASHSLYAIEMNTGSIRWTYQASGWTVLDHDLLYINNANHTIQALDARTGSELWQREGRNGGVVSTLFAATDHLAYIARDDGVLEVVNGRDGTVLWRHGLKVDGSASLTDEPAALQVTGGVVYLSTVNSSVYALRERDGALLWQFHTTQGNGLNEQMSTAFGDGMVFLSADQTYALRMSDGALLWRWEHKGRLLEDNGLLYLNAFHFFDPTDPAHSGGVFDSIVALRASDGQQVWQQTSAPTSPGVGAANYTMQLLEHGLLIVSSSGQGGFDGHLFAFSASNGKPKWWADVPAKRFSLRAWQGVLYFFSGYDSVGRYGILEAIREIDGGLLWTQPLQQGGVFITNDAIYAGIGGNTDPLCAPVSSAQIETLQVGNASLIWHRQLDPAPDPLLFAKRAVAIVGGFLALLGLLIYRISRKGLPKGQRASPLPE